MVAEVDSCSRSPATGLKRKVTDLSDVDEKKTRADTANQQAASPTKQQRLESPAVGNNFLPGLSSQTRISVKEHLDCDEILHSLQEHDVDIFNTDGDRQELMNYCEKMLAECDNKTQQNFPACPKQTASNMDNDLVRPDSEGQLDYFGATRTDADPRSSFDTAPRHAVEEQQLKSAYYFDGLRFVAIQVVMEISTGQCQLILPIDHPHHLGVPEEVPVFETKSVPIEDFKQ